MHSKSCYETRLESHYNVEVKHLLLWHKQVQDFGMCTAIG